MKQSLTYEELEEAVRRLNRELAKMKQAEKTIRRSEEKYHTLFHESRDAVYISSREDKFLDVNRALLRLFGYSRQEMIEKLSVSQIYAKPSEREVFRQEIEKRGSVRDYEIKFCKKNGKEIDCLVTGTVRHSTDGTVSGYQGIIRDVTEKKRIERLRDDINRMIRHDLKSPLIGITGLAGLVMKGDNLTDKQREETAMIKELGERMLLFIDRTRDLYQMEEGCYRLKPKEVNLLEMFQRIKRTLETLAVKRKINFVIRLFGKDFKPKDVYSVTGEEGLIEIMFSNLIKNAIEASPRGGVVSICIDKQGGPGEAFHSIDIHNMGAVPVGIRKNFFDPYTTSKKEGGTGLGTHNALLIARTHKGTITFITSKKDGTHLTVYLPKNRK